MSKAKAAAVKKLPAVLAPSVPPKTKTGPAKISKLAKVAKVVKATRADDLRGASKLLIDAVEGVTNIVEAMHRNISGVAPIVGQSRQGRTRGITGFVYRSVRGVTQAVGFGLDKALAPLTPLLRGNDASPRRDAILAGLNGVLGDYLEQTQNPLAIGMQLRQHGRPLALNRESLAADIAAPGGKLLVLVHGLCMNDLQWRHGEEGKEHDHGAALAEDLGYTPLYLNYNSGRHISRNGESFADVLEQLIAQWPVPVSELVIIGHSMGGLVTRSACHYAKQSGHAWLRKLKKIICLGTPHHGAPLERAGNGVDILLGISPYSAPLARLGKIRSAGIKDLRHGNLHGEDWARGAGTRDTREPVALPRGVKFYVVAASKQAHGGEGKRLQGDGLVPVASALGQHKIDAFTLPIPAARQYICFGADHFDLLSRAEVYARVKGWLEKG